MSALPGFAFKTIEDILEDFYQCENDREYLFNVIEGNITEIRYKFIFIFISFKT